MIRTLNGIVSVQEHVFGTDAAVDAAHGHEETETEEVAVVEVTHAVIQPGTVVVHFQNTSVADAAVMSSGWFGNYTFFTDGNSRNISLFLRRESGLCGRGFIVMKDDHEQIPVAITQMPEDPVNGI